MFKQILFLCCLMVSFSCKQKTSNLVEPFSETLRDSLTQELSKLHKRGHINGFGVALVDKNGTLYAKGFGYADKANERPYTEHTIQNIGSVSKTLIGIALLKASETGKLHLDDPINKHLPFQVVNPNHPDDTITIRHLATHTSSIADNKYYDLKSYVLKENDTAVQNLSINEVFNLPTTKLPMIDFLSKILSPEGEWFESTAFTKHKPGAVYEYSNIGATLAAVIIETATGSSFDDYTSRHILKPLKMNSTGWTFNDINFEQHSVLYSSPDNELPFYSLITYPDGGLLTNTSDLSKYLTELIKGKSGTGVLLKQESYRELFKEQLPAKHYADEEEINEFDEEFNSGIFMGHTPAGYLGHTGGDPGITTFMFFDPKTETGRILMINTSIINQEGLDQFIAIWNTLGNYERRMN